MTHRNQQTVNIVTVLVLIGMMFLWATWPKAVAQTTPEEPMSTSTKQILASTWCRAHIEPEAIDLCDIATESTPD